MDKKTIHPLAEPIILKGAKEEVFLLIHGYTGSPSDFNGLPEFLHKQHDVSVFIPLLPGHGTRVEDLRGITKDDFIQVAEAVLKDLLAKHSRVIVGGHSFGGQVALHLAARYPVSGIFVSAMPYKLRFPFSVRWLYYILIVKEFWTKRLSERERRKRDKSFFYADMPIYGFRLLHDMNKELQKFLLDIKSPILSIYLSGDAIAHTESGDIVSLLVNSKIKKTLILNCSGHSVFYTDDAPQIYSEIADFFKIGEKKSNTVCAGTASALQ